MKNEGKRLRTLYKNNSGFSNKMKVSILKFATILILTVVQH